MQAHNLTPHEEMYFPSIHLPSVLSHVSRTWCMVGWVSCLDFLCLSWVLVSKRLTGKPRLGNYLLYVKLLFAFAFVLWFFFIN